MRPFAEDKCVVRPPARVEVKPQSACLRKNAGISISSMPLLASASTFAAACVRLVRYTLVVLRPSWFGWLTLPLPPAPPWLPIDPGCATWFSIGRLSVPVRSAWW